MRIHPAEERYASRIRHRITVGILILVWSLALFLGGALAYREGFHVAVGKFANVVSGYFRSMGERSLHLQAEIPRLEIVLTTSAYRLLAERRASALQDPILLAQDDDWVKCYVRIGDEPLSARIRLKGDWTSHLADQHKWSFRIEAEDDGRILGMKRFSLHHPRERNYVNEWVFLQALSDEGIVAPRYVFLNVVLNEQPLGIYALEEHFETRLLEDNQRRQGPILRFDETLMWEEWLSFWDMRPLLGETGSGDYLASAVDAFDTKDLLEDAELASQYEMAANLLQAFRRGELATSQIFDVDLLARFFALSDLFGAEHGTAWHNVRFYYNPITGILEPIGFDALAGDTIVRLLGDKRRLIHANGVSDEKLATSLPEQVFSDPIFFRRYVQELERISSPAWIDDFFARWDSRLDENLAILQTEFGMIASPEATVRSNAEYIRQKLMPLSNGIHVFLDEWERDGDRINARVSVGNLQWLPVEFIGLIDEDGDILPLQSGSLILQPRSSQVEYVTIDVGWTDLGGLTPQHLPDGAYKVLGASNACMRQSEVSPQPFMSDSFAAEYAASVTPNIEDAQFLEICDDERVITFSPGKWEISQSLLIPAGYEVRCSGNTELVLVQSASLVSLSPLSMIGTADDPILIRSVGGGGVLVLPSSGTSTFEYVIFSSLSGSSTSWGQLSGAVTFYETDLILRNCVFADVKAEDTLNLIRSSFAISDCLFTNVLSDAVDADFCNGTLIGCQFLDVGNDAMDFSGSEVHVAQCVINGAGDKGISAGESSHVTVSSISISRAYIGVASKDLSKLRVEDLQIANCTVGVAVYEKKSEFGEASVVVNSLVIDETITHYLVEAGSELSVDGVIVHGETRDVYTQLYGE